jgi:hypothetical protein
MLTMRCEPRWRSGSRCAGVSGTTGEHVSGSRTRAVGTFDVSSFTHAPR